MKIALALISMVFVGCGGAPSASDAGLVDLAGATADAALPADLGGPAPTYASFAKGFLAAYCVSCHPSSTSARDFTQYAIVKQNAHNMACGVSPTMLAGCSGNPAPSQFPIGSGPFPSDGERNELVAWIQAGLPQ